MRAMLLETMLYEHWLRYYFLEFPEEAGGAAEGTPEAVTPAGSSSSPLPDAVFRIPAAWAAASRELEPHLFPLLQAVQGRVVSPELARGAIVRHMADRAGGDAAFFEEELLHLLEHPAFQRDIDSLHGWIQALAAGEVSFPPRGSGGRPSPAADGDREDPVDFNQWRIAFRRWTDASA